MSDPQPPFPGTPSEPTEPKQPAAPEAPDSPAGPPAPPAYSTTPQFSAAPSAPQTPPSGPTTPAAPVFGDAPAAPYASPTPPPLAASSEPTNPYAPAGGYPGSPQSAPPAQYPPAPYAPGSVAPKRGNGLGLASLIVGGLGLIGSFIPFVNYVSGFVAFVGLVLGIIALFLKGRSRVLALIGSIVSFVALALSIILAIVYTSAFVTGVNDVIESNYPSFTSAPVEPGDSTGDENTDDQGAPVSGDIGSHDNPAPIGSTVELSQLGEPTWQVTVNAPTFNADAEVAAQSPLNDTAPAGMSFALLPLTTTYIGAETGYPVYVQLAYEAADGSVYNQFDTIATAPGGLDIITELSPGGSASGNVAIAIPSTGAENGLWVVSSLDGTKFYFAAQ